MQPCSQKQQYAYLQDIVCLTVIGCAYLSVCICGCVFCQVSVLTRAMLSERPQPCSGGVDASWTEVWLTLAFSSWQGWQCQAKIENVALLVSPTSITSSFAASALASSLCLIGCLYTSLPPILFVVLLPHPWHENQTFACTRITHYWNPHGHCLTTFQTYRTKPFLAFCNWQYWPLSAIIQKCKLDKSITLLSPWATVAFSFSSEEYK